MRSPRRRGALPLRGWPVGDRQTAGQATRGVRELREYRMCPTPIEVVHVDETAGTIRLVVVAWRINEEITVPVGQFEAETGLDAAALAAARWLEAEVNVFASRAQELRFRSITLAPDLPPGFMGADTA